MLHVHNGDSSANILKGSGLPGEHLVWREALIAGPTPRSLSKEDWYERRARHLADAYALDFDDCRRGLIEQEEALLRFSDHEEVVLWFEHDLFCQTLLIYLLDWFSQQTLGRTKLSLICINSFPGLPDFRGLGELKPAQMASLFEMRREVTGAETRLAVRAWEAYCSPNPQAVEDLLDTDTSALRFLKAALTGHLARFPSARNGLGRIENKALELVGAGYQEFVRLFSEFGHAEPVYGLGDMQFWNDLKRMSTAHRPLLVVDGPDLSELPESQKFTRGSFSLTEAGNAVLSNEDDFLKLNAVDYWLGGVHLFDGGDIWRWNEESQKIVPAAS